MTASSYFCISIWVDNFLLNLIFKEVDHLVSKIKFQKSYKNIVSIMHSCLAALQKYIILLVKASQDAFSKIRTYELYLLTKLTLFLTHAEEVRRCKDCDSVLNE